MVLILFYTQDVKALQKLNFIRINEIFMESSEPEKSLYQIYIWIL